MKKSMVAMLIMGFLLQGCFSYKKINYPSDPLVVGQKYKVEYNDKTIKAQLVGTTDSTLIVSKTGGAMTIKSDEITAVRARKFSILKTATLPITVPAAMLALVLAYYQFH